MSATMNEEQKRELLQRADEILGDVPTLTREEWAALVKRHHAANDPGPTPDLDIPPDGPETDPRF